MGFPQLRSRGRFAQGRPGPSLKASGSAAVGFVGTALVMGALVSPTFAQTSFVSSPESAFHAGGDSFSLFVGAEVPASALFVWSGGAVNFVSGPQVGNRLVAPGSSFAMFVSASIEGSVLEAHGRTVATAFASVPTRPGALVGDGHGEAMFVAGANVGSVFVAAGSGQATLVGGPITAGVLTSAGSALVDFKAHTIAAGILNSHGQSGTFFLAPGGQLPSGLHDRRGSPAKGRTRMRGRRVIEP